jgi:DnaJ like chaperone protein
MAEKSGAFAWVSGTLGTLFKKETLDPKEQVFISVLFALLGSLARADGVVTHEEAEHGEELIARMGLSKVGRKLAFESFERGRAGGLDIDAEINYFLAHYPAHSTHAEELLDALLSLAKADGRVRIPEKSWLTRVGKLLGVDAEAMRERLGA